MVIKTSWCQYGLLSYRVAVSSQSALFNYAQVIIPPMISFRFRHFYCIIFSYVHMNPLIMFRQQFLAFLPSVPYTKTDMRDATECIDSIGYGLFDIT